MLENNATSDNDVNQNKSSKETNAAYCLLFVTSIFKLKKIHECWRGNIWKEGKSQQKGEEGEGEEKKIFDKGVSKYHLLI